MIRIRAEVKDKGALKKLQKKQLSVAKAAEATVNDLARLGQTHAQLIAPRGRQKKLISLIKVFKTKKASGPGAEIHAQNPTANDGHFRNIQNFDLVKWMHATRGVFQTDNPWGKAGKKHIKTGSPTFMYRTRDWLRSKVGAVASSNFNKIKIK